MPNQVVNELNEVLKGEYMAVDSYENLMTGIDDLGIKAELKRIQDNHKTHADEISRRILDLGGRPQNNSGLTGWMAGAKHTLENVLKRDTIGILKKVYDGEDQRIALVEEIIKGDLDEESMDMVKQIISDDHDHLRKMANLIGKLENGD